MLTITRASAAGGSLNATTEGTLDWLTCEDAPNNGAPRTRNPVWHSKRFGGNMMLAFDWVDESGGATPFTQGCNFTKSSTASDDVRGSALAATTTSGGYFSTNLNYGFRLVVPVDRGVYTIKVYTEQFSATVSATARLTDGSEADATLNATSASGGGTTSVWTITVKAARRCELALQFLMTAVISGTPNLKFMLATMARNSRDNQTNLFGAGLNTLNQDDDDTSLDFATGRTSVRRSIKSLASTLRFASGVAFAPMAELSSDYYDGLAAGLRSQRRKSLSTQTRASFSSGVAYSDSMRSRESLDDAFHSGFIAGFGNGGGDKGDIDAPTVSVMSPTPGTAPGDVGGFPSRYDEAKDTAVILDVTDLDPGLSYVAIIARFYSSAEGDNPSEEVVYRRGQFRGKYVESSNANAVSGGLRLTIRRKGGWPSDGFGNLGHMLFAVDAVDGAGNTL